MEILQLSWPCLPVLSRRLLANPRDRTQPLGGEISEAIVEGGPVVPLLPGFILEKETYPQVTREAIFRGAILGDPLVT